MKSILLTTLVAIATISCGKKSESNDAQLASANSSIKKVNAVMTLEKKDVVSAIVGNRGQFNIKAIDLWGSCLLQKNERNENEWKCGTEKEPSITFYVQEGRPFDGGDIVYTVTVVIDPSRYDIGSSFHNGDEYYFTSHDIAKLSGYCEKNSDTEYACQLESKQTFEVLLSDK